MNLDAAQAARVYRESLFPDEASALRRTDPEFVERFGSFAFDEVMRAEGPGGGDLDERTRCMAVLAALLGCQGVEAYRAMLSGALEAGLSPVEAKEIAYQAVAYLGIGRVLPFLSATNDVLAERGEQLPLEGQATAAADERLEAGNRIQVDVFGEGMRRAWEGGPEEMRHINRWLADNCFGDWYTRGGLDLAERELITFCFLAAQGGCEPQLAAHARGNMNLGNDRAFLVKVVSQLVPYLGYPRCLNALACVNDAAADAAP